MKHSRWLIIAAIIGCIFWDITAVAAEEPELATEVTVQTANIVKMTLRRFVSAYGLVEPEPARGGKPAASSKIAAPLAGLLTQIHCEEGQQVKKLINQR